MNIKQSLEQRQAREPEYEHFTNPDSDEPEGTFICDSCGDVVQGFKKVDPSIQDAQGWVFFDDVTVTKCCESTYYEDEGEEE